MNRRSCRTLSRFRMPRAAVSVIAGCGLLMAFASATAGVPDPELSPFGVGSSALRSRDFPRWIPQMVAIGLTDLRSFGGGWGVEPELGKFDWTSTDEKLAFMASQNVQAGVILMGRPKWDPKASGGLPMNNLPEWSVYVSNVVAHTKGKAKYFEVWNEPPNGTKNAPPSDYAKLMVASYDAAKSANPDAMVGLAAKSAYLYYLDAAIKAGAKGHYDYITLHPYEILGTVIAHPGTEPIFLTIASKTRKMLAAQDPTKVNIPIIFTEIGFDSKRSVEKQAEAVVKTYTMGIAQGIACIQWFEGMDGDSGPMGLIDAKGNPRPAYAALGQLIQQLGRHPDYLGWLLLNDKHYAFVFQGAKGTVLATWAATVTPEEVDFGQRVQIVDPPTGKITEAAKVNLTVAPILVVGVPDRLVTLAKANRRKPFTWGGDHTDAKSVSVTMGEKYVEKGLHTMAADSIAADVVAYGGNARAGMVPKGGNVFMVDPNFLSYTTVPIEITAIVKRDERNEPAKLVLEYESTSGYKKLDPEEVPDNKEWHTITWKIGDPQFVASWAFDFRFNSGKYCVQSVTVTKVGN